MIPIVTWWKPDTLAQRLSEVTARSVRGSSAPLGIRSHHGSLPPLPRPPASAPRQRSVFVAVERAGLYRQLPCRTQVRTAWALELEEAGATITGADEFGRGLLTTLEAGTTRG